MNKQIEIKDLLVKINSKTIIDSLELEVTKGEFLTVLSPAQSGKTTLAKVFLKEIKYEGNILLNGKDLRQNKCNLEVISVDKFYYDTVYDELSNYLKKNKSNIKDIPNTIKKLLNLFDIENTMDYDPKYLSNNQKKIVILIKSLLIKPDVIIIDDVLSTIDYKQKQKIFKYLKKINKESKTTIINLTSNVEDSIHGKHIAILNKGKIVVHNKTETILSDDKLFQKNDLELPILADLSIKLKYYGLLDKVILKTNRMVDILWK